MTETAVVHDLVIEYRSAAARVRALDGAQLEVAPGEVLAVVGESGSGKSTLGLAMGRLLGTRAHRLSGEIRIGGRSVYDLSESELRRLRAEMISYVFQDPIGTLDPTRRIGLQVKAALGAAAGARQVEAALSEVGLADPARVSRSYPHELSGGMAQRVSICMAIAGRPMLVVADEPTAALDASIKVQILDLIVARCRERGTALLLLSHDLLAVRARSDRVAVMYGGRAIETGPAADVFSRPSHPYTAALLRSAVGYEPAGTRVNPIPGVPPSLTGASKACAFAPRCVWAEQICSDVRPQARRFDGRDLVCHRAEDMLNNRHAP